MKNNNIKATKSEIFDSQRNIIAQSNPKIQITTSNSSGINNLTKNPSTNFGEPDIGEPNLGEINFGELTFKVLTESDIDILTPIMKRAFDEDTRIHLNEPSGGPDGYDNGNFLRKFGLDKNSTSYKISLGNNAIGCIILWINPRTKVNFLGNIFIDVDVQNKGIGRKIWSFIEQEYPDTLKWKTETPGFSKRNHNFYVNKCGFHIIKIENPKDKYECSYIMEKKYS